MSVSAVEIQALGEKAEDVARVLKALANPRRLMLLCKIAEQGGMSVGQLADSVSLSQSALSQHLAVMREERLIAFDREGQTLRYRIADARLSALLESLYRIYCAD